MVRACTCIELLFPALAHSLWMGCVTGARITWIGFAVSAALQAALIVALGDEDAYGVSEYPYGGVGVREPLVEEETRLRAPLSTV